MKDGIRLYDSSSKFDVLGSLRVLNITYRISVFDIRLPKKPCLFPRPAGTFTERLEIENQKRPHSMLRTTLTVLFLVVVTAPAQAQNLVIQR